MKKILFCLIFICCLSFLNCLDLNNPDDYFKSFIKTRADLSGQEVVYWWKGFVYSFVSGERDKAIMQFEGFNIGRVEETEGGYILLTREAAFYQDLRTGEILESWENPFTGKTNQVVHVWNDPVNQYFVFPDEYKPFMNKIFPSTQLGDYLSFNLDIFLHYQSPLSRAEYPANSQSDWYEAAEMFQFFVKKDDLLNLEINSAPAHINWTRISPWMPFMEMGDTPGNMVFSCVGQKLENGFLDLPDTLKNFVMKHKPEYASAPEEYSEPNETSWTYFKKLKEKLNNEN